MKKTFILTIAMVATLCAAATDRFYIEDFSISAGETKQVSIILENTAQYTAFQTDIYLPEGLTVEKEDDEYAFELTSRKSRDHVIFGEDRPDGAIRLMSYSMQVKPFTDNSGALVSFNVIATANFCGGAVELKHTLFTDLNDQEFLIADETSQAQLFLKPLTGDILISEESGGGDTNVYIKYTGEEDVNFSIYLLSNNETRFDLLNDYSDFLIWDDVNKLFIINILELERNGIAYIAYSSWDVTYVFSFEVCVYADGYETGYNSYSISYSYVLPGGEGSVPAPIIYGDMSDLTFYIGYFCNAISEEIGFSCSSGNLIASGRVESESEWAYEYALYAVDRLDHDYHVTAKAYQSDFHHFKIYTEETFLVPARTCNLFISQYDSIKPIQEYFIVDNEICFHAGEKELGTDFAIIESSGWDFEPYGNIINPSISINDRRINNPMFGLENHSIAVSLLPFGDIYGGEHLIETTFYEISYGSVDMPHSYCNSLSVDTIIEYYPISTRVTPDSFIFDVAPDMGHAMLRINGEEVELSTEVDSLYYALDRRSSDYSVTVQVGDKVTNEYGEVYTAWSQETTIIVPTKLRLGDANGDGIVNVSDVTLLISKILGEDVEPFITENADITGDGTLNVADVTALIQLILNN